MDGNYNILMEELRLRQPNLPTFPGLVMYLWNHCTLTGVFIFIGVIFLVLCLYYVISRSTPGIQQVHYQRPRLDMIDIENPFFCQVDFAASRIRAIKCTIKCDRKCYVQGFWRAPIYPLFELLHENCQVIRNAMLSNILDETFGSKCGYANEALLLSADEKKLIEFRVPEHIEETVLSQATASVREAYPFVILMILDNNDDINNLTVVAMATCVHMPDRNLQTYSRLIGRYIKLSSGDVRHANDIYLSSATHTAGGEGPCLCVVCYQNHVSIVFLPCRHACVCSVCLERCEKCPFCRASTTSYFELPENYQPGDLTF